MGVSLSWKTRPIYFPAANYFQDCTPPEIQLRRSSLSRSAALASMVTVYHAAVLMNTSHDLPDIPTGSELPEVLHPDVYKELRKLAANYMLTWRNGQTLQPTMLVHEAWLRLAKQGCKWRDRGHFFATASIAMRHILIDHARRKSRSCHGGDLHRVALQDVPVPNRSSILLLLDEGITELEQIHPERARVVVDRFFGGRTNQEIAKSLGIGERSVERHWAMAKVWLLRWLQDVDASNGQAIVWPHPDEELRP
jgi:RNA polymerase sigma factor (TIGR02999 family)